MKSINRYVIMILITSIMCTMLNLTYAQRVYATEYEDLRAKWKTLLTGGSSYDLADPDIAARIASFTQTVLSNIGIV